jgi:hypothetical protein
VTVGKRNGPELKITDVKSDLLTRSGGTWNVQMDVENTGDVHATLDGELTIKSLLGKTVHRQKLSTRPLLPGAKTMVQAKWRDVPLAGIYRATIATQTTSEFSGATSDAKESADGGFSTSIKIAVLPPWWFALGLTLLIVGTAAYRRRQKIETGPESEDWDESESED